MIKSSLKRFKRSWSNQTQLQVATTSVLAGTFTLLLVAWSLFSNFSSGLDSYKSEMQVTAYLSEEFKGGISPETKKSIAERAEIESFKFVSAKEAFEKFKARMQDHLPELFLEGNEENPLPSTLEIQLKAQVLETDTHSKVQSLVEDLRDYPEVEDVSFGMNWAEQYSRVTRAFTFSGYFIIFILLIGGIFVIGNSVSQSVYQKRNEIEVLELFGATRRSIVVPYVVEGALTGLIAGVFSLIFSAATLLWLKEVISAEIGFIGIFGQFHFLSLGESVLALVVTSLIGALSAYLFVNKITTGWSAAQRGVSA